MSDEKKIIIDEDWKSQVQAEKEAAATKRSAVSSEPIGEAAPASESQPAQEGAAGAGAADPKMPPASFEMLVTTLATEALASLGQFPHPATGKAEINRNHAQYLIDTLDVLRDKTKGNLTSDEQQLIESVLHQMRMLFITVANQSAT